MQLSVNNLKQTFGKTIVFQNVNFTVSPGEIVALIGRNGSGKTTLMQTVIGILQGREGTIRIDGTDINKRVAAKKDIVFIPDRFDYFNNKKLTEVVEMYELVYEDFDRTVFEASLQSLNLRVSVTSRLGSYSKGERMLVACLLALSTRAKFLLLDEPFDGIDVVNVDKLNRIIIEAAEYGTAIIISSHRMETLEKIADRTLFIEAGGGIASMDGTGNTGLYKYQLVSRETLPEEFLRRPDILLLSNLGRVYTILTNMPVTVADVPELIIQMDELSVHMEDILHWQEHEEGGRDVSTGNTN
ncbi:MAG: ATP-binding cassette domain-containing protein [Eubacteriales bacterium]|nr:ATP-binding cassette domain-containing protein [Eubacteriales bacterium]